MTTPPPASVDPKAVTIRLRQLQEELCRSLEEEDGSARFHRDAWTRPEGGSGLTCHLSQGAVFEKAVIAFSEVSGASLPISAQPARTDLAGTPWTAVSLSLVLHPHNPYVPTSHANVRFFCTTPEATNSSVWWFGGGFDLTPFYGFEEDAVHWHRTARDAVAPFGSDLYPRFKRACDDYFFLTHRGEPRGVGGLFFDNFAELGFDRSFALTQAVGAAFLPAYRPIVARRKNQPYGERERSFQLYRRGRYAEFNLVQDRGTLFGLQSGGRVESILASLPPLARWDYAWAPDPGSPEARLSEVFLKRREWI